MPTYRNGELVTAANEAAMNKKYGAPAPRMEINWGGGTRVRPLLPTSNNQPLPKTASAFAAYSAQNSPKTSAYSPQAAPKPAGYSAYSQPQADAQPVAAQPKRSVIQPVSYKRQPPPTDGLTPDEYGDLQDSAGRYTDMQGNLYGSTRKAAQANYGTLDQDSAKAYRQKTNQYEPSSPLSSFLNNGELQFRRNGSQSGEDYLKWLNFTKPNPNDWTENELKDANLAQQTVGNYGGVASRVYERQPNGTTTLTSVDKPSPIQERRQQQNSSLRPGMADPFRNPFARTETFDNQPAGGGFDYRGYIPAAPKPQNPGQAQPVQPQSQGSAYNPQAGGSSFPAVPDLGNLAYASPDQRPAPFTASYGGIDGSYSSQPQTSMRDAFITQANNAMMPYYANAGVYQGQGAPPPTWGQAPKFNIPQMMSNARQMVDDGYTNPLSGLFSGQMNWTPPAQQAPRMEVTYNAPPAVAPVAPRRTMYY